MTNKDSFLLYDKVICIDNKCKTLTKNKIYDITGVNCDIVFIDDSDRRYSNKHFRLVDKRRKFEIGDVVVCIRETDTNVKYGNIYTIYNKSLTGRYILIEKEFRFYNPNCFILKKEYECLIRKEKLKNINSNINI